MWKKLDKYKAVALAFLLLCRHRFTAWLLKAARSYVYKHWEATSWMEDMVGRTDPAIKRLYDLTEEINSEVSNDWQRLSFRAGRNAILFLLEYDLAYHHQGKAMLRRLVFDGELYELLKDTPPESYKWYVNRVHRAKAKTVDYQGRGLLLSNESHPMERLHVDSLQPKR